jgi:hypothetical protein
MFKVRNNVSTENHMVWNFNCDHYISKDNGQINYLLNILEAYEDALNGNKSPERKEASLGFYREMYTNFTIRLWTDLSRERKVIGFNGNIDRFRYAYRNGTWDMIEGLCRNPLKEAAWCLTHGARFNASLPKNVVIGLIQNATYTSDSIQLWNKYIECMSDISDKVKVAFTILPNKEVPVLEYIEAVETVVGKNMEDAFNTKVKEEKDEKKEDTAIPKVDPSDSKKEAEEMNKVFEALDAEEVEDLVNTDVPVEEAGAEKIAAEEKKGDTISHAVATKVNESAKESATEKVTTDESSKIVDSPVVIVKTEEAKTEEVPFDKPMKEVASEVSVENKKLDTEMKDSIKRDNAKEEHHEEIVPDHPSMATPYGMNNAYWETNIPKLNILTNICVKNGYSVLYNTSGFPGIISADVVKGNDLVRQLLIDPQIVYGDTIRVIPCTNKENFDIRKEMFIPISNKALILKAIEGTITKEDRKKFFSDLPRVMSDYREKYHILDRVDFRCLTTDGKPLNFFVWRSLVTNVSKVLASGKVTGSCRFRIVDMKDANHFRMVCDDKVLCAYPSAILNDPDALSAMEHGIWVDYNVDTYKGKEDGTFFEVGQMR